MAATDARTGDAAEATALRINFDLFDLKCAELGALSAEARAALAGVDRITLWRWRNKKVAPSQTNLSHIASTLGVSLDELTGRKAA